MIPIQVYGAIGARAYADTGSGGLFASGSELITGFYNTRVPEGAEFPYVEYNVVSSQQADAFAMRVVEIELDMHVYVAERPQAGGTDPFQRGAAILARIAGDWSEQATRLPSYGFDRHPLDLSAGTWTGGYMERIGGSEQHEDGMLHWVESYRLTASKVAT